MEFGVGAADVVCVEGERISQDAALRLSESKLAYERCEHGRGRLDDSLQICNFASRRPC
jgi:hypothetical protein